MEEDERQRTGKEYMVKGTSSIKAQRQEKDICTWQYIEEVSKEEGKDGCEITVTPVQIRNVISIIGMSMFS